MRFCLTVIQVKIRNSIAAILKDSSASEINNKYFS